MMNNTRTSLFGSWSYRLILTLTVLAFTINARPQAVSAYAFAQSAGTYTSITGGTALSGATWDNTIYTVAIPSFPFAGAYHTTMYVSTNGFITFGSATASNEFDPISSNGGYAGAISAFGADVENSNLGSPLVRWEQVGGEIVVQWTDARRQNVNNERVSFQIRLNTTTGVINIVYGGTIAPQSSTNNYPEVGLRGSSNSFPSNVNNRRVDATPPAAGSAWSNTAAGADNDSECRFNNSAPGRSPVVGQTYTWTPPCLPPTSAAAGADQSICTTTGSSVIMAANTPSIGTGGWSQVSGTAATITTPGSTTTTITGLTTSGARTFRWTISNGASCTSSDDVVITVNAPPATANAGPDQTMCVSGTTPLAASSASPGTGAWSILAGSPSTSTSQLSSTSSPTATFDPSGGTGVYTLRWTTSNLPCASTQDDVAITVAPTPTTSAAGADQTLCASFATLAANTPAVGTGAWSIISVPAGASNSLGQFSNTTANNATFTPGLMVGGAYTLRWTISNSPCSASTDNVVINWNAPPVATFTPVDDCANQQFNVEVNVSSFGTGSNAQLQYTVDGGAPISMPNIGMGTTTIGPFAVGSEVNCTVTNGQGTCSPVQAILYSNCAVTIPCGTTLVVNHCYRNNDTRTFLFTSSNPFETVTVTFISGTMAAGDVLQAYSGTDENGTPLGGLTGSFPSLNNASATSFGPSMFIKIVSDGSNSCATGQQTSWQFEAECTPGCVDPDGVVNLTTNCGAYNFGIDVEVLSVGDGSTGTTTLQYTVNGGTPVQIPGLMEFQVQNIGPFAVDDVVNVRLLHADSPICNKNLGSHTDDNTCPSAENCVNALNLAMQTSPLPGTTVGRANDFSIACGTASTNTAADAIYFMDVPNGWQFNMRQQTNNYNSQHYMRYGGSCPGANVIACVNDDNGEVGWVMWTNSTGSTQRVWWIQDGSGSNTGTYTLEWQLLSCPIPIAAAATGVTNDQANANFTAPAGSYIVEWGPAATFTTPGLGAGAGANGTVISTATSPVLITGLSATTQYRYFVRRDCGGGSFSPNSTEILFTTTNAPTVVVNGSCGNNVAIPDNGCGSGTNMNAGIAISGQSGTLGSTMGLASVDLIITHARRNQLRITLVNPSGQSVQLVNLRGGSNDNFGNNSNCPTAALRLVAGGAALSSMPSSDNVTGNYAPEQPLTGFSIGSPNGNWILQICDNSNFFSGALRHVELNFLPIDCQGILGGTSMPGTSCNDGDPCTINDLYTGSVPNCGCAGTFEDTDGDGTCNANDGCPNDPNKIAPGACGCGVADVPETYYADTDGDGFGAGAPVPGFTCITPAGHVLNDTDLCPTDANKQAPGVCGCGVADVAQTYYPDTDGDGFGAGDPVPGHTCFVPVGHVTNNTDLCADDPLKQDPGACGCGVADVAQTYYADTDGDGFGAGDPVAGFTCAPPAGHVTNNTDLCADDPLKQSPGGCGCGVVDVPETYYADTDGDGFGAGDPVAGFTCITPAGHVLNNTDLCPTDANKQAPGVCGCGVADVAQTYYPDTDGDGFGAGDPVFGYTCFVPVGHVTNNTDLCADDPLKQDPGACGCGVADVAQTYYADTDGDGFGAGDPVAGFTCIVPDEHVTNNTDLCADDPLKQSPGGCGCGVVDVPETYYADTDGDGFGAGDPVAGFTCMTPAGHVLNNTDLCPTDANKQAPGVCGCGVADVAETYYADTDGDGFGAGDPVAGYTCIVPGGHVLNNTDLCPEDALKQSPGACGCGVADVAATYYADTDGDGFGAGDPVAGFTCIVPDEHVTNNTDLCPDDALKQDPGVCGCGVADVAQTYYADTDGDGFGAGDPVAGFTCIAPDGHVTNGTDLCPDDANKQAPSQCGCGNPDTDTDGDLTADCNDLCPLDPNKIAPGQCGCGNPDTDADGDSIADCVDACPLDPDNDQDNDGICGDIDTCPTVFGQVGNICDANPGQGFTLGALNSNCVCAATTCTQNLTIEFQTDMHPNQISWELREQGTNTILQGGAPLVAPNGIQTISTCVPNGCYFLKVLDSGGDGIANGGYILRTAGSPGTRIIDNRRNFNSGAVSQIAGNEGFCVPFGTTTSAIYTSCDKLDWVTGEYVVCSAVPAVSAVWNAGSMPNEATTGYEFQIFNPNGGYIFNRFRAHNQSDLFAPDNATRACHMKINNWAAAQQIPANVLMNVRIRTRINGVNGNWGPACRFKIDPVAAACPLTKLMDIPGDNNFSCNSTRMWGTGNYIHARPVSGATQYQWRFRIDAESFISIRTTTTYFIQLNWITLPLQNGKTYQVEVRALKGGAWCVDTQTPAPGPNFTQWGDVCNLTIDNTPFDGGNENILMESGSAGSPGQLSMYPNPNRGDQLYLSLDALGMTGEISTITVDITDLYGKSVNARTIAVNDGILNTVLDLDGTMANGLYMVNITAGEHRYTERLVIQR